MSEGVTMESIILILIVFLPFIFGALLPAMRIKNRKAKLALITTELIVELTGAIYIAMQSKMTVELFKITDQISISFAPDSVSNIFALIASSMWLLVGIYAFEYMKHEENEDRFFAFFIIAEGALLGMDYSSNLVAMYIFFEMVTLSGLPLILHTLKKEAIFSALKYLFYSIAGAFMALLGILFLSRYAATLDFAAGGTLDMNAVGEHRELLLAILFVTVVGMGTKAGLYPMHGWLPAAHPVAPAPASAVLSAVIAKSGVLGIIRFIYYVIGTEFLAGTWVQYTWLALAVFTVFMGSMMAYRENVLKKRLAYSTVSQVSYVLIGVFLLSGAGVKGALLHTIFHAVIKTGLFLTAGAIIVHTGKTKVDELYGIGKKMPITIWCFTFFALALVGIPPFSGFVSKWYLAGAAISSEIAVFSWLAPVVLLISALLTAGYLLSITVNGFFPGKNCTDVEQITESKTMSLPLIVLAALALLLGVFSGYLTDWITAMVDIAV